MLVYTLIDLQRSADPHLARRLHGSSGLTTVTVNPNLTGNLAFEAAKNDRAAFELSSGTVFLRIPYPNLCSLALLLAREPEAHAYSLMLHVSQAAALLPEETGFSLDPEFIFLKADAPLNSGVVFLTAPDVTELRQLQGSHSLGTEDAKRNHHHLDFDPPGLSGSAVTAFGLAALWYHRLSSEPFCINPEAPHGTPRLYERFRESFPTMPTALHQAFDACIDGRRPTRTRNHTRTTTHNGVVPGDESSSRTITELLKALPDSSAALSQILDSRGTDPHELHRREVVAARSRRDRVRRFDRREFLRRRGVRLAIISGLVLFFGGIAGTSINRALQPPVTHGLGAGEVVRLHYAAINELDPELLRATLARGVASRRVDELTTMYVTSRARMSVEMETGHYRADEWIDQGRPELSPTVYPYGVSTPTILELTKQDSTALYEARFIRVDFAFEDNPQNGRDANDINASREQVAAIREYHVREQLQLERRNEVWRIVAIDAHIEELSGESY